MAVSISLLGDVGVLTSFVFSFLMCHMPVSHGVVKNGLINPNQRLENNTRDGMNKIMLLLVIL